MNTAKVLFIALFCVLCFKADAFALGGGGFRNEAALDAEAIGKGQAFVAQADSPSAVHFNPAGLVQLDGEHLRVGYTYEGPRNSHTDTSGNESQMQMQSFMLPSLYFASDLGHEKWRFGLGVNSPYGLGTDWADDSFARYQSTESDLEIFQLNPTVAYKVNDILSVGAGLDYVTSHISKHKVTTPLVGEGDFQLKGSDEALGYNIGLLYRPSERHSFGLSYRSKLELIYEGVATIDNISALVQAGYNFPSASYCTDIESKLVLPRSLAAGYAFRPDDKWTFEIDLEWTGWSCIEEDFVKFPSESDPNRLTILNDGNPLSKDWRDSLAYGIGAEYKANDKLALRCGYLFVETPIPSATFETALPDSDKHNFTFGVGYKANDSLTIDAAYEFVLLADRDVTNDIASASSDLDGKYEGYVNIVAVSFTYRY